ncbi:MAG: glycoside hydrolase family 99-like domain-containing protein [Methylococcales bacterium]
MAPLDPVIDDLQLIDAVIEDLRLINLSGLFNANWYLGRYSDVGNAGVSPLVHFYLTGASDLRSPCYLFDTSWYLKNNPDVAASGTPALIHYIRFGECEGRAPSPLFDPGFYVTQFAQESRPRFLLRHFLHSGAESYQPNQFFDPTYYLEHYPEARAKKLAPFEHYLHEGWRENREISSDWSFTAYRALIKARGLYDTNPLVYYLTVGRSQGDSVPPAATDKQGMAGAEAGGNELFRELMRNHLAGPHFEDNLVGSTALARTAGARAFAFYLPQFYPFAENDEWWGKGFTEWRNVSRALPRFVGHRQPRLPRNLGFYDLRNRDTIRAQVDLARASAIAGFCFYYYWFNGKRLLDQPLDAFLTSEIDFSFCLMWANENWTRSWDGLDNHVLMKQDYFEGDDVSLVDDLARYFQDPRYERVDERPLFFIYRPGIIPGFRKKVARWREIIAERHGLHPLILMAQGFGDVDPRPYGLDGAIEFPPHKLATGLRPVNSRMLLLDKGFSGHYFSYDDLIMESLSHPVPDFELIRTAVPSWDNEPRNPGRGMGFVDADPDKYEQWLRELTSQAAERPFLGKVPYVFVNAWNEWAEGATLEPDLYHGVAYLNSTLRALVGLRKTACGLSRVLLVGHDAYLHGAQLLLLNVMRTLRLDMGVEVSLLVLEGGPLVDQYRALGDVTVVAEQGSSLSSVVKNVISRHREKVAICNTVVTGKVVEILGQQGFRVISLVHELSGLISERGLESHARLIANRADRILFAASFVKSSFERITGDLGSKAVIRPQGIYQRVKRDPSRSTALHQQLGISLDSTIVFNLGYGDLRKGFDLFVEVAKSVIAKDTKTHFVWLGKVNGDLMHWLGVDIGSGQLAGRFHVLPFDNDPNPYLNSAAVLALTSREDPFPSVVLEALACGVPVVGFEGGGAYVEAIVKRDGNGFVVPMGDVDKMSDAILRLFAADDEKASRQRAEAALATYGWREYVFSLLEELLPGLKKVSVVVPNYNYAKHLPARLASIFEQDYPIYELIVLDDASTDNSLEILSEMGVAAKRRFDVVGNEINSGNVFRQWETGLSLVSGDYVWIAEADDLASDRFLSDLMATVDDRTAMAFCDSRQIAHDGVLLGQSYKFYYADIPKNPFHRNFVMPGRSFVTEILAIKNVVLNVSSVIWNCKMLRDVFARSREEICTFKVAGDWRLYSELLQSDGVTVSYIACPNNVHRRHTDSATHTLNRARHLQEISDVQDYIAAMGLSPETRFAAQAYFAAVTEQLTKAGDENRASVNPEKI